MGVTLDNNPPERLHVAVYPACYARKRAPYSPWVMKTHLYRVVLKRACYGVIVDARTGKIVEAAPIAKKFEGETIRYFSLWVKNKGGTISRLR